MKKPKLWLRLLIVLVLFIVFSIFSAHLLYDSGISNLYAPENKSVIALTLVFSSFIVLTIEFGKFIFTEDK